MEQTSGRLDLGPGEVIVAWALRWEACHASYELQGEIGEVTGEQGVIVPPPCLVDLVLRHTAQFCLLGTVCMTGVGFFQRRKVGRSENLIDPVHMGLIQQLTSGSLIFNQVAIVSLLLLLKLGGWLLYDVPAVKQVECNLRQRAG